MSEELTDWFPAGSKPARVGVYMVEGFVIGGAMYQHWTGMWWGFKEPSISAARKYRDHVSAFQSPKWRGLTKESK